MTRSGEGGRGAAGVTGRPGGPVGSGPPGGRDRPERTPAGLAHVRRENLERVLGVVREIGGTAGWRDTLQSICDAVVDVIGFDVCTVNVVRPGGVVRTEVTAGPASIHTMVGQTAPLTFWQDLLGASERWGALRFHRDLRPGTYGEVPIWVADASDAVTPEPDSDLEPWDPECYALNVPLYAAAGGLVGILAVDLPRSGRLPDAEQCTLLELFAGQAAHAVEEAERRRDAADQELLYRTVFGQTPSALVVVGDDLTVVDANPQAAQLLGPEVVAGQTVDSISGASDTVAYIRDVLDGRQVAPYLDTTYQRPDGPLLWLRTRVTRVGAHGSRTYLVCTVEDISGLREELDAQRKLAEVDSLTGLLNRRSARARLDQLLRLRGPYRQVAVLACDLDGFKAVNDRYGHLAGDELLAAVGRRLGEHLRPEDVLSRTGGDEFMVAILVTGKDEAYDIAQRCIDAVAVPFDLAAGTVTVGMSIGVALQPGSRSEGEPAPDGTVLFDAADRALYRAKRTGKGRWEAARRPR